MERCRTCEAPLSTNEIAAYLKMVDRGAESFLCKACLARRLGTTEEEIDRKIEHFKRQGCVLFI